MDYLELNSIELGTFDIITPLIIDIFQYDSVSLRYYSDSIDHRHLYSTL